MKRIFCILFVVTILIGMFAGCGQKNEVAAKDDGFVKEIEVRPIQVKPIEVETIITENIITEDIITEDIITENVITWDGDNVSRWD
jgi:hypothetical protein